ncbi:NAD-dependent epimerase/dehydratase family protein [Pseudomonas sp. EA_35y_Pfl2_R5]|uniref:NAD-dependent epimerase/dehydratase family protein n=1 Tax=Pseudomonas sp. EA_35y_Pfl2_R5 TaxID=3088690 RepID=UPI0030D80DF4
MSISCDGASNLRCLVTGANGFIGTALVKYLRQRGMSVRGAVRQLPDCPGDWIKIEGLTSNTDWRPALSGCDVVIHTAGRAHVMKRQPIDSLAQFRVVNVDGTLALARQALEAGVRRFVFISSIGVNGPSSVLGPYTEQDLPEPQAYYAQSKLEAEMALQALVSGRDMELVIVRPPLVYSAHAPGNFSRLLKLVSLGIPLPFARVKNLRSIISLENLLDFLYCSVVHPSAANQLFLVADGHDLSIAELIEYLAEGMGRRVLMLPVSPALMKYAAKTLGVYSQYQQLCGDLQIDIGKARTVLGWQPPVAASTALRESASGYLDHRK